MPEIVAVGLDAAEGDATKAVDFQRELEAAGVGDGVDIGFFAGADLGAGGVERLAFEMGV